MKCVQLVCLANSRSSHDGVDESAESPVTLDPSAGGIRRGGEHTSEEGITGEEDLDFDGYKRTVGAGVTVVEKNEECDILDGVRLDAEQDMEVQRPLSNVDQAVLLTLCAWNRRNRARDEMNRETQGAIVDRVMLHPTNWIVFTTCLLSRCRIEMTKVQTVDRACMQMQVLCEQYFDEEPGVSERIAFIYSVPYPPRWSLKKELADSMMKIGMLRTAANIFEELGLYKEMVECYIAQDEEEEAEKIVKRQLEKERTPYMLAIMGFIKDDVEWYQASWEEVCVCVCIMSPSAVCVFASTFQNAPLLRTSVPELIIFSPDDFGPDILGFFFWAVLEGSRCCYYCALW